MINVQSFMKMGVFPLLNHIHRKYSTMSLFSVTVSNNPLSLDSVAVSQLSTYVSGSAGDSV